ncbi:hypothetical protein B0T22DRAFT_141727 [Podospora appendiculata]|uniref:Uncharacterized protein n=1 Tax=Podospora appendiculata TaxID=314037 RepID=A0AAE0X8D4_9PEZI|nr:hypothetical protein B0T22DRAFT_141727 [Podospora appendiculata]
MPGITAAQVNGRHGRNRQSRQLSLTPRSTHLAGRIMWLPKKEDIDTVEPRLEEGCYNHPVAILSPEISDADVDILIMTSFNRTDLETRYAHNPAVRAMYLPINPSPPHPDNNMLLYLASGQMERHSYVNTKDHYTIRFAILRPYRGNKEYVLTPASYKELVKYAKYSPGIVPGAVQGTISQLPSPVITEERLDRLHRITSSSRARSPSTPRPPPVRYHDVQPQRAPLEVGLFGRQAQRVPDEEAPLYQPGPSYGATLPYSNGARADHVRSVYDGFQAGWPLGGHPRAICRRTTAHAVPSDDAGGSSIWSSLVRSIGRGLRGVGRGLRGVLNCLPQRSTVFAALPWLFAAAVVGPAFYGAYWTGIKLVALVGKLVAGIALAWANFVGFFKALPGRVWEWIQSLLSRSARQGFKWLKRMK